VGNGKPVKGAVAILSRLGPEITENAQAALKARRIILTEGAPCRVKRCKTASRGSFPRHSSLNAEVKYLIIVNYKLYLYKYKSIDYLNY
jgi:hypothetical protein